MQAIIVSDSSRVLKAISTNDYLENELETIKEIILLLSSTFHGGDLNKFYVD